VSITGIKVQSSSASVGGAPSPPADGSTSTPALKQRTAAFNGSLGFFTLGLSIDVLGEFQLQRCGVTCSACEARELCAIKLGLWIWLCSVQQCSMALSATG